MATRFTSTFLSTRAASFIRVQKSEFNHFFISTPILSLESGTLTQTIEGPEHQEEYDIDDPSRRVRTDPSISLSDFFTADVDSDHFRAEHFFSVRDCLFRYINVTSGDPREWERYDAVTISRYCGGCIYALALTLHVDNCFFYQVHSYYAGSLIWCRTEYAPVLSHLGGRVLTVSTFYSWSESRVPGTSYHGAFVVVITPVNQTGTVIGQFLDRHLAPMYFNYSAFLDTAFTRFRDSPDSGGFSFRLFGPVRINGINFTQVDGTQNGGIEFDRDPTGLVTAQKDWRVQFSHMSDCLNLFLGVICVFAAPSGQPEDLYELVIDSCNFVRMTAEDGQPLIGVTPKGTVVLSHSAFVLDISVVSVWSQVANYRLAVDISECLISGPRSSFVPAGAFVDISSTNVFDSLGRDPAQWPNGLALVDLGDVVDDIPVFTLADTRPFTPSQTFTPHPVQGSASIFAFGSQVSTGVIATIFGILSFIGFLFLLYLRKNAAKKFRIIGILSFEDEFDGEAAKEEDYDLEIAAADSTSGKTAGSTTGGDESYSYSVSYEYSYSED